MTRTESCEETRTASDTSYGINSVIAACNKNDRFKLLEDNSVLPANLENPIHPIFEKLNHNPLLKQMLQLASQFLSHDSILIFFVPLIYGHEVTFKDKKYPKTHLSDPVKTADERMRKWYIRRVRQMLHCLAHSTNIEFAKLKRKVYARTLVNKVPPPCDLSCPTIFQKECSARIEINESWIKYYEDGRYSKASGCAQFRHDFLFAITILHEIVHAVGVMYRGNLIEPFIRRDYPENEWGTAFETWLFGRIINPKDQRQPGTDLLMQKYWAEHAMHEYCGGKEHADVPMAWVAQWFQQETWAKVSEEGPLSIPPPETHFKIRKSNATRSWVISSSYPALVGDLLELAAQWTSDLGSHVLSEREKRVIKGLAWSPTYHSDLQKARVAVPLRLPQLKQDHSNPDINDTVSNDQDTSNINDASRSLKRGRRDSQDGSGPRKKVKKG